MSVFRKLSGLFKPQSATEVSKTQAQFVERAPRISLLPVHQVHFRRTDLSPSEQINVANLSLGGAGFVRTPGSIWPLIQNTLRGSLTLKNESFDLELKVVFISHSVVGCEFLKFPKELPRKIAEYFKLEIGAQKMIAVKAQLLKPVEKGKPHYFYAENFCDLYFIVEGESLLSFTMTLLGNSIEGEPGKDLRFGHVEDAPAGDKPSYKGSSIIHSVSSLSPEILSAGVLLLENIQGLPAGVKETISRMLSETA